MKRTLTVLLAGTALTMTAACAVDELSLGSATQEGSRLNGSRLNGSRLNGTGLFVTAAYPNPGWHGGEHLDGTYIGRSAVTDVSVYATELSGKKDGSWISGTDFSGAMIPGVDSDGHPVKLYIEKVIPDASGLYYYDIIAVTNKGKEPLCVDDAGNTTLAVAIAGLWDHHEGNPGDGGKIPDSTAVGITFACRDIGATAKCLDAGYWPWLSSDHDLAHQACVRMIRADYCGDGRSWTKDGTLIDIEDEIPEQLFAMYDPTKEDKRWLFEATWGPDGATCIENYRYHDHHPGLGTSIADEIKMGTCGNLPRRVDNRTVKNFLGELPAGSREGHSLCGWEQPKSCDPKVQTCAGEPRVDYYGYTTVNAKGPGTW